PRAVRIDNPEVTDALIFDFINPGSSENDLSAVRRDGRIADALHIHESLFVERSFVDTHFSGLSERTQAKGKQKQQKQRAGTKKLGHHRHTSYEISFCSSD